jgi:bile salt-stimulated lipase
MFGSAHAYSHPEYFMDEDVIFVTFNYRLGIFGFLSTADNVVPGNGGLKDQVLALKWVQQNIASFGGNPESVTLTGMSSGASSVHFHYLSDMSRGLFHRGFSQSGVSLNSFALQDNPLGKAKHLGELVGCPTSTTFALVKCLKQRPAVHLLSRVPLFFGYAFLPVAPFAPVLEKGPKPFLNKNPYFLLAKGKTQNLPWLVSTVSHEGFFPASCKTRSNPFDTSSNSRNSFAQRLGLH